MNFKKKFAAGTALIGATAIGLHMINKIISFSAQLDDSLGNPSGFYYNWRFGKIFYSSKGSGKPVLLIHDLTTFSSACEWNGIVNELSKTRTVYCIDLLGCGRSDKPNLTYTNYLYVELVVDFIKHVIGDKTDVIATGESGSFVLAACQNDSSVIDQVFLVNPAGINLLSEIPSKRSKLVTLLINSPIIGTFVYNMFNTRKDVKALFELDYYSDISKIDKGLMKTFYGFAHSRKGSSKHLFASMAGYYTTINIAHCLESLTNSIFIITGGNNEDNKKFAEQYKDILPCIELIDIPNSKYLPQLETPAIFLEQISILINSDDIL